MQTQTVRVIAISGPSGAGKTTLVKHVAIRLGHATTVSYDSYASVARWHPDIRSWVEQGSDPNQWVSIPELVADVRALREGHTILLPGGGGTVEPAPYVVMEEPWGRDRDEMRPWIDFVVHIAIPLDISLCRKLLREYPGLPSAGDPLDFVRDYLSLRLGDVYQRQQQVAEHADLVVDGRRPPEELVTSVVEYIRRKQEGSGDGAADLP